MLQCRLAGCTVHGLCAFVRAQEAAAAAAYRRGCMLRVRAALHARMAPSGRIVLHATSKESAPRLVISELALHLLQWVDDRERLPDDVPRVNPELCA